MSWWEWLLLGVGAAIASPFLVYVLAKWWEVGRLTGAQVFERFKKGDDQHGA